MQYFMPYSEVGYVKNATKDALLNVELKDDNARLVLYTSGVNKDVHLLVKDIRGALLFDKTIQVSPVEPFIATFPAEGLKEEEIRVEVRDSEGKVMLTYQADKPEIKPVPDPAKAAKEPKERSKLAFYDETGNEIGRAHV